jgi:hypothetical protein
MLDIVRTTCPTKIANRAEIVRAHENAHDTLKKRQFSQLNQRCARARSIGENHLVGGGIYALLPGRACESYSYSTHARTTGDFMGEAA